MLVAEMAKMVRIDVANDFSPKPFGRYPVHGRFNGQRFRVDFLESPLLNGDTLFVDIDGVAALSSSFLDEAFAGLVRQGIVPAEQFFTRVTIKSDRDPSYIDDIRLYVSEAGGT